MVVGSTGINTCCHSNGYSSDTTDWTHDVNVLQLTTKHRQCTTVNLHQSYW